MKQRHWIAVTGRTVVLVSFLGSVGLLLPGEADARPTAEGRDSGGAASAGGETTGQAPYRRLGRAKGKHQKRTTVGGARSKGKARSPGPTRGRQAKLICEDAFDKAKEAAQTSRLREANEWFTACARASCARALRQRCAAVQPKVAALIPSVVPVVTDSTGAASSDAEVRMDGEVLTSHLDGAAIVVDPGDHVFTFAKDGEVFATKRLSLEKGQRHQLVSVMYQPKKAEPIDSAPTPAVEARAAAPALRKVPIAHAALASETESTEDEPAPRLVRRERSRPPEEAEPRTGAPWSAYALAGVGVLGVGGYWTFNLKGSADNDALVAFCKPRCDPTSVRHVRNIYLAADISLGIGLVALASSTYLFLRSDSPEKESPSPRLRSSRISQLSVQPTSSGAFATVGGTF